MESFTAQPLHAAPEGSQVLNMEQFELIRRMVLVDGLSVREVARRLEHSRKSIRKALKNRHRSPIAAEPRRHGLNSIGLQKRFVPG